MNLQQDHQEGVYPREVIAGRLRALDPEDLIDYKEFEEAVSTGINEGIADLVEKLKDPSHTDVSLRLGSPRRRLSLTADEMLVLGMALLKKADNTPLRKEVSKEVMRQYVDLSKGKRADHGQCSVGTTVEEGV